MLIGLFLLIGVALAQKLGPGDNIRIVCEQEPTLSVDRAISPQGTIDLPIIGRFRIAGLYIGEAEEQLQHLASEKLRSDRVLIAIALIADESAPIQFSGAVRQDGAVPYRTGLTLADVVKLAQPTVAAETETIEITSAEGRRISADLTRNGGELKLRPGDRVFFPRATGTDSVLVLGGVQRPGSRHFEPGLTLRKLIELAGGIAGHGESGAIRLKRTGRPPEVLNFNSADAEAKLERGDVVFVPMVENGRYVSVTGFVNLPGLIEYRQGMTLSEALAAAGGLKVLGDPESVTVKRLGEWKRRFDLTMIASKLVKDLALEPDDIIDVPLIKPHRAEDSKAPGKKDQRSHPVVPPS